MKYLKFSSFLITLIYLFSFFMRKINVKPNDLENINIKPKVKENLLSKCIEKNNHDKEKLVIVTIHGFAGIPYENKIFIDYALDKNEFLYSLIMMGGHGTNTSDFKKSTWKDWQKPVEKELDELEKRGYKNINIMATSTGCTILLEILSRKKYQNIKKIILVAPIVEPYYKIMKLSTFLKKLKFSFSIYNNLDSFQEGNWYKELPLEALSELNKLTKLMKKKLKKGLILKEDLKIMIIQSRYEKIVDPISAYLVANGLKKSHLEILLLDSVSHLPVIYRSSERENKIRLMVFDKMLKFLNLNN